MTKKYFVLICLLSLALIQVASADNVGLGFEYNTGYKMPSGNGFNPWGLSNGFTLSWMVGDNLVVGVFGQSTAVRGSMSYSDDADKQTPVVGSPIIYTINNSAMLTESGLRLLYTPVFMDSLEAGMELGAATFSSGGITYSRSDGTLGGAADWNNGGQAPQMLTGTTPLIGLNLKWTLLNAKSKGIWTAWAIGFDYHVIPIAETAVFGSSQSHAAWGNTAGANPGLGISTISNFNNADLTTSITLGF